MNEKIRELINTEEDNNLALAQQLCISASLPFEKFNDIIIHILTEKIINLIESSRKWGSSIAKGAVFFGRTYLVDPCGYVIGSDYNGFLTHTGGNNRRIW